MVQSACTACTATAASFGSGSATCCYTHAMMRLQAAVRSAHAVDETVVSCRQRRGKCNSTKVVWGLSIGVVMGARPSGARVGSTEDPSQTQARFAWFASEGHLTGSVIFRAHAPGRYKRGPGGLVMRRHLWKPVLESEAGSVCEHGCLVPAGRKQLRIEALVCSSGKCLFHVVWKPRLHRSHVDPVEFALSILARQKEGLDREKDWWRHGCIITFNHILAEAT